MTATAVAIPETMTKVSFKQDTEKWVTGLRSVCHPKVTPEGVVAGALHVAIKNPQVFDCEPKSIFLALSKCARLGLYPGGGMALVPLRNSVKVGNNWQKVLQLEAWPEYQGLKALAYRQRMVVTMEEHCVYERDDFEYALGLDPFLRHRPANGNRGELTGAYSLIRLPDGGGRTFHYMTLANIEEIRAKSRSWGPKDYPKCPGWYAKKTVVRDFLNRQPKEGALVEALAGDDAAPSLMDPETGEVLESGETVAALGSGDGEGSE